MSRQALPVSRRTIPVLLTALLALLLTAPAAQAAPGDNLAVDDPFSSSRTQWWRDGRFGMFIHFGVYAQYKGVYGTCRDAEWIKRNCSIPWSDYEAKAAAFNPTQFDAQAIVNAAKAAGQKYIVITSKHHDGFSMWPTAVNDWDIADRSGFSRDILGELKTAADAAGIKFGLYYSIWDWHDPDAQPGSTTYQNYLTRMYAQLKELKDRYDPALFWFDGEWEAPWNDRHGEDLERYMRGLAPNAIINNRVGTRQVVDGDYGTPEQFIPDGPPVGQPWESCMTMNGTWGYAQWDTNYKSVSTLTRNLIGIAANSGVFLLNIGPTDTGAVPQPQLDRLAAMGDWLRVNGPAVHGAGHTRWSTSRRGAWSAGPRTRCTRRCTPGPRPVSPCACPRAPGSPAPACSARRRRSPSPPSRAGTT
ncbi:alpha-L-fucosidase [Actinokineospora soli]|uniref:alpha-L-fucosidase n=1 Tax=Actinokineospora soli TaxID=1048753 RepID=A0ABW2TKU0_9PSEU